MDTVYRNISKIHKQMEKETPRRHNNNTASGILACSY